MRKIKKFAAIISLILVLVNATTISAYAETYDSLFDGTIIRGTDSYYNTFDGYTEITDNSGMFYDFWYSPPRENAPDYKVYVHEDGGAYIYEQYDANIFSFTLNEIPDIEIFDAEFKELIASYDPTYYYDYYKNDNNLYVYNVYSKGVASNTLYIARDVCEKLRNENMISNFYYGKDYNSWSIAYTSYLMEYEVEAMDDLKSYINEKGLDCEVVPYTEVVSDTVSYEKCRVVPNYDITEEEKLKLAKQLEDDLGYYSNLLCPEICYPPFVTVFDLYNAKYGDVDGSGKLDALDASEILTYYAAVQTGKSASYTVEEADNMALVGDYDGDGAVNAMDASNVLTRYAEEQTS